jgi:predicted amidohydrolase YtcJ
LGTLESGKFADIVITDADLFSEAPEALKDCSVWMTIMDGKIVYAK